MKGLHVSPFLSSSSFLLPNLLLLPLPLLLSRQRHWLRPFSINLSTFHFWTIAALDIGLTLTVHTNNPNIMPLRYGPSTSPSSTAVRSSTPRASTPTSNKPFPAARSTFPPASTALSSRTTLAPSSPPPHGAGCYRRDHGQCHCAPLVAPLLRPHRPHIVKQNDRSEMQHGSAAPLCRRCHDALHRHTATLLPHPVDLLRTALLYLSFCTGVQIIVITGSTPICYSPAPCCHAQLQSLSNMASSQHKTVNSGDTSTPRKTKPL